MKYAVITIRILLAIPFLIFGANDLHSFIPVPPMRGDGGTLAMIMMHHGWFLFIGILHLIAGFYFSPESMSHCACTAGADPGRDPAVPRDALAERAWLAGRVDAV